MLETEILTTAVEVFSYQFYTNTKEKSKRTMKGHF